MKIYHAIKNELFSLMAKRKIGARILLIRDDHVLLVKHTYQNRSTMPCWLPGKLTPTETFMTQSKSIGIIY